MLEMLIALLLKSSNQNWISGVSTDGFTIGINEQIVAFPMLLVLLM
jgi:hypothetical protein